MHLLERPYQFPFLFFSNSYSIMIKYLENQIKFSAKYIHLVSLALNKEKILSKKFDTKSIENLIKKRFSLCWRWFYRMQIPLIIGYHKFMQDLSTFHIWGTICMNQVLNVSKELNPVDKPPLDYFATNNVLLNNLGSDIGTVSYTHLTLPTKRIV